MLGRGSREKRAVAGGARSGEIPGILPRESPGELAGASTLMCWLSSPAQTLADWTTATEQAPLSPADGQSITTSRLPRSPHTSSATGDGCRRRGSTPSPTPTRAMGRDR